MVLYNATEGRFYGQRYNSKDNIVVLLMVVVVVVRITTESLKN
jgi:hypothetical protein